MTAETLFGLIFIAVAMVGLFIGTAIEIGVFDKIAIILSNYIVNRIERLEGKDI